MITSVYLVENTNAKVHTEGQCSGNPTLHQDHGCKGIHAGRPAPLYEVRATVEEYSPDETWTSTTPVYFDEIDDDQVEVIASSAENSGPQDPPAE